MTAAEHQWRNISWLSVLLISTAVLSRMGRAVNVRLTTVMQRTTAPRQSSIKLLWRFLTCSRDLGAARDVWLPPATPSPQRSSRSICRAEVRGVCPSFPPEPKVVHTEMFLIDFQKVGVIRRCKVRLPSKEENYAEIEDQLLSGTFEIVSHLKSESF